MFADPVLHALQTPLQNLSSLLLPLFLLFNHIGQHLLKPQIQNRINPNICMISRILIAMAHPAMFDGIGQNLQPGIKGEHYQRMGCTVAEPGYILVLIAFQNDQVTGSVHVDRSFPMPD
jgi:hypothetical protein